MTYETGIAQNERDLLDKINTFLTSNPTLVANGQAWTVLYQNTVAATSQTVARKQIMWKSTGTGIEQDIYIGCETVNNISDDTYNLHFFGGTFFNAQLIKNELIRHGVVNCSPRVTLFADARAIEYHVVADGRHCKIITRISNVISSAYFGFILPTVPPTEYPYPLCISGSAPDSVDNKFPRYSLENYYFSSIAEPLYRNCYLFTPDQTWREFFGYLSSGGVTNTEDGKYQLLFPLCNKTLNNSTGRFLQSAMVGIGSYPLIPIEFISTERSSQGVNRWGAYDGVYWIPGVQRATGDVVTIDKNRKGIVFNSGFRSSTTSFFVIDIGEGV